MKLGERLKSYINYFQCQMTLVYSCNEDVATAAFISGLQVIYSFYKYLVKNDVTKVRDILVRAQKYMQIEEATRSTITRPLREAKGAVSPKEKSKSHSVAVHKPPRYARESNKDGDVELEIIPFRILVDYVFNAIKDQPWVKRPTRSLLQNLMGLRFRDYCAFHGWVIPPSTIGPSNDISRIWLIRDISGSSSSTRDTPGRLKYKGNTHHMTVRQVAPSSSTGR